ncbi:MAG: Dabb family protein [Pseudomonadota bacterium]
MPKTILHCVFLKTEEHCDGLFAEAMDDLSAVVEKMEGASDFSFGPNADFEKSTPEHSHGFIIRFTSEAALQAYAEDPEHQAVGAKLVAMCKGGKAGISVFDLVTD